MKRSVAFVIPNIVSKSRFPRVIFFSFVRFVPSFRPSVLAIRAKTRFRSVRKKSLAINPPRYPRTWYQSQRDYLFFLFLRFHSIYRRYVAPRPSPVPSPTAAGLPDIYRPSNFCKLFPNF